MSNLASALQSTSSSSVNVVEWPADPDEYELLGRIGQGAFASVWKARLVNRDDCECAIKVLNLDHVDSNLSEIRLEVQAMRLSLHPNILACHAAFVHSTDLWLATQLMRKGSSLHCLQSARRRMWAQALEEAKNDTNAGAALRVVPRMEEHILYILHETLLGLKYIHENGQIHRDIKAGNILLDSNGDVRIADFGVSGWLINAGSQQEKAKTFVGTPCWMAPEVMEQIHGYDYKADIWSLGITALELAKGYAPYAKYPPMKVLILTIQEDPPSLDTYDEETGDETDDDEANGVTIDDAWSPAFRGLVNTCLQKDPSKRPDSSQLLESKYLSALQDESHHQKRRDGIRTQVCDLVPDVGNTADGHAMSDLPGNTPISIIMSSQGENRPPGTTWVFADGSQVLASTGQTSATVDDVMAELDQFGLQTGGEHYTRESAERQAIDQGDFPVTNSNDDDSEDHDDLNAFMDEFELNTQGENFRREN